MVQHTACPRCRKNGKDRHGDNLAIYEDGHSYCFSCGFFVPSTESPLMALEASTIDDRTRVNREIYTLLLPDDVEPIIPSKALFWLESYGITQEDVIKNRLLWSEKTQYLIFPIFGEDNRLLFWQGRNFNKETLSKTKWYSVGDPGSLLHILGKGKDLVLVEDIISAIKVGKVTSAMPLFGSYISLEKLELLRGVADSIVFWLDQDKYKDSYKFSNTAKLLGFKSRVIVTLGDPKTYVVKDIEWYLKRYG